MRLSDARLLAAWETSVDLPPAERAVHLLHAAHPVEDRDALARLPVGLRDARLLTLRERLFGAHLSSVVGCPACGERLELALRTSDLVAPATPAVGVLTVTAEGCEVRFRLPNTEDLASVTGGDLAQAGRRVLARCVLEATRDGAPLSAEELPEAVVDAVEQRMAEADPQGDVALALDCPACGQSAQVPFDIAAFLWAEVDARARRLLGQVHVLASAYGWSELRILGLSTQRRELYIQLVAG